MKFYDDMGHDITALVERLKSENEAYKLENLKLKQAVEINQEPEKEEKKWVTKKKAPV